MNFKNLPATIILVIGGIITLLASTPLISDFFPIITFPNGQLGFLGTRLPNLVTVTQINGWTFIGFAGYELTVFYMGIGAIAFLIALNTYLELLPIKDIKGVPINSIASLVFGVADLGLLFLIYISPISNVNGWGLSPLSQFTLLSGNDTYYQSGNVIGATLGLGFVLLLVGGILLIIAGLLCFVLKPSTSAKKVAS